jgi:hypothetical protein
MARSIGMAADATVYRAAITKQHGDKTVTTYEGPYGSIGAARARVSFWTNYLADRDDETGEKTGTSRAGGYVEQGTVTWERVS